jgi:hypothetical protein
MNIEAYLWWYFLKLIVQEAFKPEVLYVIYFHFCYCRHKSIAVKLITYVDMRCEVFRDL